MAKNHSKPLIIHVLDRLSLGGMETVAVNLIEHSRDYYYHRVICLRGFSQSLLMARLERLQVPVQSVDKQPGKDLLAYVRLRRMLRDHHPDIVHTYNIGTIDVAICARLAGVRHVVHAEHGRDAADPHGHNPKYRWLRRLLAPAISAFVAVSEDLFQWLERDIGLSQKKIRLIYNGIDIDQYDAKDTDGSLLPAGFAETDNVVIGTVGRLDPVKAYDILIKAFARLVNNRRKSGRHADLRLVIVGYGSEYVALKKLVQELGLDTVVWLAGQRDDVPELLQAMDIYVCSSIAEGVALTLLEAMASGLPVMATEVGGNPELILPDETGDLIPAADVDALALALEDRLKHPDTMHQFGIAARARAETLFSIESMVSGYCTLYDQLLGTTSTIV